MDNQLDNGPGHGAVPSSLQVFIIYQNNEEGVMRIRYWLRFLSHEINWICVVWNDWICVAWNQMYLKLRLSGHFIIEVLSSPTPERWNKRGIFLSFRIFFGNFICLMVRHVRLYLSKLVGGNNVWRGRTFSFAFWWVRSSLKFCLSLRKSYLKEVYLWWPLASCARGFNIAKNYVTQKANRIKVENLRKLTN